MNITCVTSRYLPNLRHIARLFEVDTAVILDLAPLPHRNKDSFIYRNRIANKLGTKIWLSLPVKRRGVTLLKDARIDSTNRTWVNKHIKSLSHFYPDHRSLAGDFLEKLRYTLTSNDGSLIDINTKSLNLILDTLRYSNLNILYQSSIVDLHTFNHRLEISKSLEASTYTAGHVEWNILTESGLLENMRNSGLQVLRSPDLETNSFPLDLTVNLSCVHSICFYGIEKTRKTIDNMIKSLKNII